MAQPLDRAGRCSTLVVKNCHGYCSMQSDSALGIYNERTI